MPQISPINEEQSAPILRRSLRLHPKNPNSQLVSATNNNPDAKKTRIRPIPSSSPKLTLNNKTLKPQPQDLPPKLRKTTRLPTNQENGLSNVNKSQLGNNSIQQSSKRTASRSCKKVNSNTQIEGNDSVVELSPNGGFLGEFEKRITRSSLRRKTSENVGGNQEFEGDLARRTRKAEGDVKLEAKMRRKSREAGDRRSRSKLEVAVDLSEEFSKELGNGTKNGGEGEEKDKCRRKKEIGVKRKRNQVEKGKGISNGWNSYQELALQRAYVATKPTPHFWKKVARLVPGKSAQECFDKVHSGLLTPPQHQPRTRARTNNTSSPLSCPLSASDLLKSPVPNVKNKRKSHLPHKTVRHLLHKNYQVDSNYEADLFSVLESTSSPPPVLSTPEPKPASLLIQCLQKSTSLVKKQEASRFSRSALVSPPVLKQVKNKALHEKYIDQLHSREAKRKAAASRAMKSSKKEEKMVSDAAKIDAIKAAKDALVFDARDAINLFQNIQANALSGNFSDEEFKDEDEDEDEAIGSVTSLFQAMLEHLESCILQIHQENFGANGIDAAMDNNNSSPYMEELQKSITHFRRELLSRLLPSSFICNQD